MALLERLMRGPALACALSCGLHAPGAAASDEVHAPSVKTSPRGQPSAPPARYLQECGSCHVAYPPGLLDAAAWRRQMSRLDRHYGSDATLDAASAAEISAWLRQQAGSGRKVQAAGTQDRISDTPWFRREHHEVSQAQWDRAKSPGRCDACHTRAAEGRYSEHEVRIPSR